jgi:hypothetical protein
MVIVNVFLTILKVDQDYVNDVFDRQMVQNVVKIHFELIKYIITISNINILFMNINHKII